MEEIRIETTPKSKETLNRLAKRYFRKKGYEIKGEASTLEGHSGILRNIDLIVQKGKKVHFVWIKDWRRTIGVNIVINLDKISDDLGTASPIIIGEKFSDHAKAYANRRKIVLLTKRQVPF